MSRWLPVALVLVVLAGVVAFGLLRPGAEPSRDPADVQRRLDAIPRTLDCWTCGDDLPLTERAVNVGRFQAYLSRSYADPTGAAVAVLVLYGEPGDIGAHDPRLCYAGSGWELSDAPRKQAVGKTGSGGISELWSARFRKQDESLQVYWGWGVNGDWRADDNPRFTFARHRRILKVYAQRLLPHGAASPETHDPLAEFVPAFLQCVDDALPPPDH